MHCELFCGMKLHVFREKIKQPINKHFLSPTMYHKWMDEFDVLSAIEEDQLKRDPSYLKKSFADTDIEHRFSDKPICKLCVRRYRTRLIAEDNVDSDSDCDSAAKPSSTGTKNNPCPKNPTTTGKAKGGAGSSAPSQPAAKKKSKKKESNKVMNVELDLNTHPVTESVPWNHISHYPVEKLRAPHYCATSRAGQQNWPITLTCMTIGIEGIDGKLASSCNFISYSLTYYFILP